MNFLTHIIMKETTNSNTLLHLVKYFPIFVTRKNVQMQRH